MAQIVGALARRGAQAVQELIRDDGVEQRNARNVLIDGLGIGASAGIGTFLSIFLVRLGASPLQIALLTAMPALTGILLSLPLVQLLERQRNIVPWFSRSRVLVFVAYLLTGLIPLVVTREALPAAIIFIWALVTVPQTVVTLAFTMVIAAAVTPERRYWLLSWRWASMSAVMALTVMAVGWFLERVVFPLNYQLAFVAAFGCGVLSFFYSRRIVIPDNPALQGDQAAAPWPTLRAGLAELRALPEYVRFVGSSCVYYLGLMLALPIFPLFWVRELQASDFWIGLISTVSTAVLLVGYFVWAALSRQRGPAFVLLVCSVGLGLYPLLAGLSQSVAPLLLFAAVGGFCAAGIDLVQFDLLLKTCPQRRSASYIALYRVAIYTATFVGPLLGTALAELIGLRGALFASAGLRLLGALLFWGLRVGR
jgi:hypothetical protein